MQLKQINVATHWANLTSMQLSFAEYGKNESYLKNKTSS